MTKHWYATFGHGQHHPLTGENLMDCYTLVPGETYEEAHGLMMQSVFGARWAFLYEHADGKGGAGVERWKMREVAFIPPSPLSPVVWAAVERFPSLSFARWVEFVAQPVEVAWHRAIAALDASDRPHEAIEQPEAAAEVHEHQYNGAGLCQCEYTDAAAEANDRPDTAIEPAEAGLALSNRCIGDRPVAQQPATDRTEPRTIAQVESVIQQLGGDDPQNIEDLIAQREVWEEHARLLAGILMPGGDVLGVTS